MQIMYLDESGNHGLVKIDPLYPIFVLGGVIIDEGYAKGELTDRVQQFKRDLFGRDDLILHTSDITRNRNGFERMKEPAFRARFYSELNQLMRDLEYKVVACVIKIGWYVMGKRSHEDWNIIEEKFRRRLGTHLGAGLVVLPKN